MAGGPGLVWSATNSMGKMEMRRWERPMACHGPGLATTSGWRPGQQVMYGVVAGGPGLVAFGSEWDAEGDERRGVGLPMVVDPDPHDEAARRPGWRYDRAAGCPGWCGWRNGWIHRWAATRAHAER